MRPWMVIQFIAVIACGPAVGQPQDASTGESGSSGTTSASTDGTAGSASANTSGDPSTSSPAETSPSADATTSDGSSEDGVGECTNCDGPRLGATDVVEEGYSAADIIGELSGTTVPLVWSIDAPETTLTIDLEFAGGAMNPAGPECCDICNFIHLPCPGGIVFDATVTFATADGLLQETGSGRVEVVSDEETDHRLGRFVQVSIDGSAISGTLPQQTSNGMPIAIESLTLSFERVEDDGQWTTIVELWADGESLAVSPSRHG